MHRSSVLILVVEEDATGDRIDQPTGGRIESQQILTDIVAMLDSRQLRTWSTSERNMRDGLRQQRSIDREMDRTYAGEIGIEGNTWIIEAVPRH